MSTPMTPAQAAQNSNRDQGGRYSTKTHAEADLALTPAAAVSTKAEPFTRDTAARLEQLRQIGLEYTEAEADRRDLYSQSQELPLAQHEASAELYRQSKEAEERASIANSRAYAATVMAAAALDEDSDEIRHERISEALGEELGRSYVSSPEHVAYLAQRGNQTLDAIHAEGIGKDCRPVTRASFQREMTAGTKIEAFYPERQGWEPREVTKQNGYEMTSKNVDGREVHLGYSAGQSFRRDSQGNYLVSADEDAVPYAIFRTAGDR